MGGVKEMGKMGPEARRAEAGSGGAGCISSRRGERDETHINRHVFPQAPSPTMTSFRRSSAILKNVDDLRWGG